MAKWIIFEDISFDDATCDITIDSLTVTCDSSSDIEVNQVVVGAGIQGNTKVATVNSAGSVTSFTLNKRPTATNINTTLTFFYIASKNLHSYPIENLYSAFITNNTSIVFYVRNPNNTWGESAYPDDKITITTETNMSVIVLEEILNSMAQKTNSTLKINNIFNPHITSIAWSAGAT